MKLKGEVHEVLEATVVQEEEEEEEEEEEKWKIRKIRRAERRVN